MNDWSEVPPPPELLTSLRIRNMLTRVLMIKSRVKRPMSPDMLMFICVVLLMFSVLTSDRLDKRDNKDVATSVTFIRLQRCWSEATELQEVFFFFFFQQDKTTTHTEADLDVEKRSLDLFQLKMKPKILLLYSQTFRGQIMYFFTPRQVTSLF